MSIIRPVRAPIVRPIPGSVAVAGSALPWEAGGGEPSGEPTFIVGPFSDSAYYASANGLAPVWPTFTASIGFKLITLPTIGQTHYILSLFNAANTNGWGYFANVNGLNGTFVCTAGNLNLPVFALSGGDAGKTVVVYITCDGTTLRHYVNGPEVASGTAMAGHTYTVPDAGSAVYIGRDNGFAGIAATGEAVACVRMTSTVMTALQIAQDAAVVTSRATRLIFPTLPGESVRFVARDLVSTPASWPDRDGNDLSLTRTGAPTVAAL